MENKTSAKEINAKFKGYSSFITIHSKTELPSKHLAFRLSLKNISEVEEIRFVKILLFPYDKNGLILVPDLRKTPELICEWRKKILPSQIHICELPSANYSVEVDQIKVHSLSLRFEDGTSQLINSEELGEIVEWKY